MNPAPTDRRAGPSSIGTRSHALPGPQAEGGEGMKPVTRKRWMFKRCFNPPPPLTHERTIIAFENNRGLPAHIADMNKPYQIRVRVTWDPGPPRSIKIEEMEK